MSRGFLDFLRAQSRLRTAALFLCLFACTLQAFVAQTHFHALSKAHAAAGYQLALDDVSVALATNADEDAPKHARRDSSSSCPLCQIALHGGAAPAPAYTLSLPVQTASAVAPADVAPTGASVAVSFSWQGRAPPLS